MILDKLASAIINDITAGLAGFHANLSLSMEQIKDEIVETRLLLIQLYQILGAVPLKDLYTSINCIDVDCKDIANCHCGMESCGELIAHFEIPQLVNMLEDKAIKYIGTVDKQTPFLFYTSLNALTKYSKYRKRGRNKPFVYIDTTPNENGMYDCFLYNAPFLKQVSVIGIFKDARQLEQYACCEDLLDDNFNIIDGLVKDAIVAKKILFYRQTIAAPNDQTYTVG